MKFDSILIRYGEMAIKGKNRKYFERKLQDHLIKKLSQQFTHTRVRKQRDRMYVLLNGEDPHKVMQECQQVFGIHTLSFAIKVEKEEQAIKDAALYAFNDAPEAKTFKVSCRRADKTFSIGSQDLNYKVGGHILANTESVTVDVHHPDVEIKIEVRNDAAYITAQDYPGAGGLPIGTSGQSLLMLSGGIDSPVAGYLMMKRGVQLEAIHFHSPPFTSDRAKQKVLDLAAELAKYGHRINVHIVPFTALQQKIHNEIPEGYSMTVMRRMMMRVSEKIAAERNILSMTTGESLGQVASQTMESMNAINEVTNYPVIRPLVAMDKLDIISISKRINTYSISTLPYEDCCTIFVPKAPKTKPTRENARYYESNVDFDEEIIEAVRETKMVEVRADEKAEKEFEDLL
ncbi:putative tRNA sulfurtransferase [Halobacillus andaensis]|uniref:Probable tRNA sulfurtransferase n=1 Tax=Halobacillus andaensis TaxID=1176239 RepID=A0A917AYS1_HALAA|nr:tRNA uracil 4-sulfurtransferase ThiI [Halobacillus andaensis]MBP2002835.1 thiamine biosynthesis protein ThiI [Halobacillus andaensis]GGF06054.1 putative tRNA sulfurtransferase [Halobacillus andaensis]